MPEPARPRMSRRWLAVPGALAVLATPLLGVAAPLACAGYGSLVTVTAVFGMVAAGLLIDRALSGEAG